MGREIPVTRAAVAELATADIRAGAFGSWVLTRWARAHEGEVYRARGNFSNTSHDREVAPDNLKGYIRARVEPSVRVHPGVFINADIAAGGSGLSHDAATDTYTCAWETEKTWAGDSSCV